MCHVPRFHSLTFSKARIRNLLTRILYLGHRWFPALSRQVSRDWKRGKAAILSETLFESTSCDVRRATKFKRGRKGKRRVELLEPRSLTCLDVFAVRETRQVSAVRTNTQLLKIIVDDSSRLAYTRYTAARRQPLSRRAGVRCRPPTRPPRCIASCRYFRHPACPTRCLLFADINFTDTNTRARTQRRTYAFARGNTRYKICESNGTPIKRGNSLTFFVFFREIQPVRRLLMYMCEIYVIYTLDYHILRWETPRQTLIFLNGTLYFLCTNRRILLFSIKWH